MKNLKAISLLLILCLVLCCCVQNNNKSDEQSSAAADTTTEDSEISDGVTRLHDNVPAADYDGYTFTFLTRPNNDSGYWGHVEFYAEEQNAVPLNDAIYERNAKIEDRFNISFANICSLDWVNMMSKSVASGDDIYDCVPLTVASAAAASVNGHLLAFSELSNIDLSQPWWDPALNKQFSIANKQHFAIGNITLVDKEATYIIMFNKDVARDFGVEDLYNIVDSGEWTIDRLMSISSGITSDIDGDGKYTYNDRVGFVTDTGATYQAMYYTGGARFFEKDDKDIPYFSVNMERASGVIDKIIQITKSNDTMLAQTLIQQGIKNPWSDDGINGMFKQGRALFYGISLTVMSKMRDMDSDFGVLPYPKYKEDDKEYISFVYSLADSITIPKTCTDPDRTSAIIEALCCESTYTTLPAYYDVTITNKTIRDEASAAQLEYIFAHRTMDMSITYNWGGLYEMLLSVKNGEGFASSLAKLEKSVKSALDKTISVYLDN
jgi:ABC-type glycerol-3-phosphate transport system substrate-binding protein